MPRKPLLVRRDGILAGEIRLAWRRLGRTPGFTAAAALTLALGIGAVTAVVTLVDAALLRPLPFPESGRLVVAWEQQPPRERERVSARNFIDWRRESRTFSGLAAWIVWGRAVTGAGEPEELPLVRASAGLFRVLGVEPALGRGFLPEEETPGRDRVVVLSHGFWTSRYGADPGMVGRRILLDGEPYEVVGVMPPGFRFPDDNSVALWTPLGFNESELAGRAQRMFNVIGRLAPGADLASARAELATIARRLAAAHPETNAGWGVTLLPAPEVAGAASRRPLLLLLGAVGFVLLLACVNVGHLFLVRALDRKREMAVRIALGAAPARLVRLLMVESAMVALVGGALGIAIAAWSLPAVRALDPDLVPGWRELAVDGRILALASAVLVGVTLASGLLPALRAARGGPGGALTTRGGLPRGVIVAEAALSVVLLIGAGLFLRSLVRLQRQDPGFEPGRVLAATIFPSDAKYDDDEKQVAFFSTLVDHLRGMPGVEAAGAVTTLPMNPVGIDYDLPFSPTGTPPAPGPRQEVDFRGVEGDYFRALGIPLKRGRAIESSDRADAARVAVVNQTLARGFFPDADPVGRRVWVGGGLGAVTVVGVVGDVRHRGLAARPRPEIYVPSAQYPQGGMTVVVRTQGDPAALSRALKQQVYAIDRDQPISSIVTASELVAGSVAPRRTQLFLFGGFAALALALAAIGVYGVVAYAVGRRSREIGIRMALGATDRNVRRAVLLPGLFLAAAGVAAGSGAAWAMSRLLAAELYEVSPHDPAAYISAALVLLAVAWAACEIPARRASRLDPLTVLRSE